LQFLNLDQGTPRPFHFVPIPCAKKATFSQVSSACGQVSCAVEQPEESHLWPNWQRARERVPRDLRKGTNSPWCAVLWCYGHLAPVKHILFIPLVKQVAVMRPGRRHDTIRQVNGYGSTPECSFVQTAVHRRCLWCLHVWLMVPKASLCVLHCLRKHRCSNFCACFLRPCCLSPCSGVVRECHKISLQSQFLTISIVRFQFNLNLFWDWQRSRELCLKYRNLSVFCVVTCILFITCIFEPLKQIKTHPVFSRISPWSQIFFFFEHWIMETHFTLRVLFRICDRFWIQRWQEYIGFILAFASSIHNNKHKEFKIYSFMDCTLQNPRHPFYTGPNLLCNKQPNQNRNHSWFLVR
jgi:hypothetical protein